MSGYQGLEKLVLLVQNIFHSNLGKCGPDQFCQCYHQVGAVDDLRARADQPNKSLAQN